MSWRNNISWRWIIRGTCLGLLGLCVWLWGLSYFYTVGVARNGPDIPPPFTGVKAVWGRLLLYRFSRPLGSNPGWMFECSSVANHPVGLHLFDGDCLGFIVQSTGTDWRLFIPLWCPTTLLAIVSLIAWRKTGQGKTGRGFPVEPLASRRESTGG